MADMNSALIEKYQLLLQSDPKSKVFAPLAEAYRKMGLLKEGLEVCLEGVKHHPNFAGGCVALGRIYFELGKHSDAVKVLERATELSAENVLAHSLLGESYLRLRRPKEALQSFKMLLFLNPNDERAIEFIKKLESLTADEYEDDVFALRKLGESAEAVQELEIEPAAPLEPLAPEAELARQKRDLERFLSLADAFLVRNDVDRAISALQEAEAAHGHHAEIVRRLKLIRSRFEDSEENPIPSPPISREREKKMAKIKKLNQLKLRVTERLRNA